MQPKSGCSTDYKGRRLVSDLDPQSTVKDIFPSYISTAKMIKAASHRELQETEISSLTNATVHPCTQKLPDPMAPGLPARATSTHQHTSPGTAHAPCPYRVFAPRHSIFLHFLWYGRGTQASHLQDVPHRRATPSVTTKKRAFCHHRAPIPYWNPSAPIAFMSEKSYLFSALTNLLQDDMCLVYRKANFPWISPRNYFPSFPT